jgi:hypothetical protein
MSGKILCQPAQHTFLLADTNKKAGLKQRYGYQA